MTASHVSGSGKVIQQRNLVEQVADFLTQAIISQHYVPGERLSEVQLARDLGISRAPVREAARLLESRGLLVSQPRRGFFVRALVATELNDIFDLRLCLERHALAHLVENYDTEKELALRRQVELMCEVALKDSDSRKIEEDLLFHRMLIAFAGNRRLLRAFDDITHELRLCIALIGKTHAEPDSIATSHWALLDALASGDPGHCHKAIDYHIGVAQHFVVKGIGEA
ncbi:GntR family transcriptional regulator [Billgrantia diversa]|uniref:GntR family transcriptional regulator n=1 Tax=Halomonas sp. MCCC 1A13316 TaxID=2733487 RepID=UPI0018A4478C|nr:GntR family transcriptional regulator [Halomonas sp. MCCC 1A13316]QOR38762.1 GntR family transcriptional regulator [Halomonas sp. MCCC 1A13316]